MSSAEAPRGDPETRRRILEATWNLIEERGARVRLVDVGDRAGVSRQAIYLHFGDRSGLLRALVRFMDTTLGLEEMAAHVSAAANGVEMLVRAMDLHMVMAPRIDRVAQALEAAQYEDAAVAAAWRDRMTSRQTAHRAIVQRIADEGRLAEGWTVAAAADLFYAITMPGFWRELTAELGWTSEDYREHVTRLLRRVFIADNSFGTDQVDESAHNCPSWPSSWVKFE